MTSTTIATRLATTTAKLANNTRVPNSASCGSGSMAFSSGPARKNASTAPRAVRTTPNRTPNRRRMTAPNASNVRINIGTNSRVSICLILTAAAGAIPPYVSHDREDLWSF
jgi:hypothetical protein